MLMMVDESMTTWHSFRRSSSIVLVKLIQCKLNAVLSQSQNANSALMLTLIRQIQAVYKQAVLQFKLLMMIATLCLACAVILQSAQCYLDIPLEVHRNQNYVSYTMPIKINDVDYALTTSLKDNAEFVLSPTQKVTKKKSKKQKVDQAELVGTIKASSLEGYSFEGWKRFFMEALLFLQSRYYHQIKVNLSGITLKKQADELQLDGLISFGPSLANNKIYQLLKNGSDFIKNDIVSIYRGVNDKNIRMQLGGFEESFARGYRNGILFYEVEVTAEDGRWWIPIKSISCMAERNGKHDMFYIANSQLKMAIDIQSPWLQLPKDYASELERNFENPHCTCKITQESTLSCINMTSVDLSLNLILLQIDAGAYINITLYDLRESYNEKTTETKFYIKFISNLNQIQIGESLFKSYYVSIDMGNKKLLFSPINRFPSESYGVYVIRFFVGFGVFTIVTAVGAMIWQTFNDPFKKNKLMYSHDGVRLVSYQRPNQIDE